MTRYLCLDLGDKRTGVAVGDSILRIASPVTTLDVPVSQRAGDTLLDEIERVCIEHIGRPATRAESAWSNPPRLAPGGVIVVGLPLNMDGSEGHRARFVREFASRIHARVGHVVMFRDERLSSAAADWTMAQSGLTHKQKKQRRDALAAAAILQSLLNEIGPAQAGPISQP
ncbi:MAG: Holliday junction resolvase RuvX [Phycisphaerales bacterium]